MWHDEYIAIGREKKTLKRSVGVGQRVRKIRHSMLLLLTEGIYDDVDDYAFSTMQRKCLTPNTFYEHFIDSTDMRSLMRHKIYL